MCTIVFIESVCSDVVLTMNKTGWSREMISTSTRIGGVEIQPNSFSRGEIILLISFRQIGMLQYLIWSQNGVRSDQVCVGVKHGLCNDDFVYKVGRRAIVLKVVWLRRQFTKMSVKSNFGSSKIFDRWEILSTWMLLSMRV